MWCWLKIVLPSAFANSVGGQLLPAKSKGARNKLGSIVSPAESVDGYFPLRETFDCLRSGYLSVKLPTSLNCAKPSSNRRPSCWSIIYQTSDCLSLLPLRMFVTLTNSYEGLPSITYKESPSLQLRSVLGCSPMDIRAHGMWLVAKLKVRGSTVSSWYVSTRPT